MPAEASKTTETDKSYARLHQAIVRGELLLNERLVELELAEAFDVGRAAGAYRPYPAGTRGSGGARAQHVRFQYRTILAAGRALHSLPEHQAVVEAVAAHNGDAAESAVRHHLARVVEAMRQSVGTASFSNASSLNR